MTTEIPGQRDLFGEAASAQTKPSMATSELPKRSDGQTQAGTIHGPSVSRAQGHRAVPGHKRDTRTSC